MFHSIHSACRAEVPYPSNAMPSNLNSRYDLTFLATCIDRARDVDLPNRGDLNEWFDLVALSEIVGSDDTVVAFSALDRP